jgi:tetratricopeptide (TPR) repeat protein
MTKLLSYVFALFTLAGVPRAVAGGTFSGDWSYQALNAGDTSFKVEQAGQAITFYRVLHPEFEGKRYKLEHMYKGELAANKISGKLFVREEGMAEFEFLRPFSGEIRGADRMLVDDMPLKRVGGVTLKEALAPSGGDAAPQKEDQRTGYSRVVIKRDKQAKPSKATAEKTVSAPGEIPRLIPVGRRIESAQGKEVAALINKADKLFAAKAYAPAVAKYASALQMDSHKVEVLYKLGVGHGTLGLLAARNKDTAAAREHLQKAVKFWEMAARYDPYNWGAKENIRRAIKRLKSLGLDQPK